MRDGLNDGSGPLGWVTGEEDAASDEDWGQRASPVKADDSRRGAKGELFVQRGWHGTWESEMMQQGM